MLDFNKDEKEYLIKILDKEQNKLAEKLSKRIKKSLTPIKPRSRKNKGSDWQKEVAQSIATITGTEYDQSNDNCDIHSREMGLNGVDVIIRGQTRELFPYDVECKNCNKISLPEWIRQAENNCTELNNWLLYVKSPVLSCKKIVVLSFTKFNEIMGEK